MRLAKFVSVLVIVLMGLTMPLLAQQNTTAAAIVPNIINYSGTLLDLNGKPLSGIQGVTFLLYANEEGGAPLWMETQNITPAENGQYTVTLGSTTAHGLPSDLFSNGQAKWLAVQVSGQNEQARILLVAVPYALKAADAQTIGGLPPSAFVLANSTTASQSRDRASSPVVNKSSTPPPNPAITGLGTAGFVPMWDTSSDIVNSILFQTAGQIGVGMTAPAAMLDVNGKSNVRDTLTLIPKATDNTLAVSGTAFRINNAGTVTFVPGQTFPGTAQLAANNTFTGTQNMRNVVTIAANPNSVGALQVRSTNTQALGAGIVATTGKPANPFIHDVGIYGGTEGFSNSGNGICCTGLWGDVGSSAPDWYTAVVGTADAKIAGFFANVAPGLGEPTIYAGNVALTDGSLIFDAQGPFSGNCTIDINGNLACTGAITGGVPAGNSRWVTMYGEQSTENWFEDAGSGQLANGATKIVLDATFAQTVNTGTEYHVFLTPKGDCEGLYVSNETPGGFEVHELRGGHSNVAFDYRIMAKRSGFEKVRLADSTERYRQLNAMRDSRRAKMLQHRPSQN